MPAKKYIVVKGRFTPNKISILKGNVAIYSQTTKQEFPLNLRTLPKDKLVNGPEEVCSVPATV